MIFLNHVVAISGKTLMTRMTYRQFRDWTRLQKIKAIREKEMEKTKIVYGEYY